jgi:hypothetical protein
MQQTSALIGVLIVALAPSVSAADDNCASVIALSRVVTTVVSDRDSVERHASTFCKEYARAKSSGKAMSASASYKFLSGSFGKSSASHEEVASKYCAASDYKSASSDAFKQYVESIAPNAYASYEQCLRLSQTDLRFSIDLASVLPTEFTLIASFVSREGRSDASVAVSSSKDVTCRWKADAVESTDSTRIPTSGSKFPSCERDDQTKRSYVTVVRTDTGRNESLTVPWQPYDESGVPLDTLGRLKARIESAEDQLASLASRALTRTVTLSKEAQSRQECAEKAG